MKYDVIIIGGGYNGLTFAGMLANAGLSVCLVERNKIQQRNSNSHNTISQIKECQERGAMPIEIGEQRVDDAIFKNGNWCKLAHEPSRLLAIANISCEIYRKHKLLHDVIPDRQVHGNNKWQPINHIRVVDNNSNSIVDFDPKEAFGHRDANFGFMVEEHTLGYALHNKLIKYPNLTMIEQGVCQNIEATLHKISVTINSEELEAKLLVACDGKLSNIRSLSGIDYVKHDYHQYATICDVEHEFDHKGVAVEKFLPTGSFAILPKAGGFSSSVVWTLPESHTQVLKKLGEEELTSLLEEKFEGFLGKLKLQTELKSFKLELVYARKYYSKRLALLGDALHAIHPLAGQGLNLSLRDADVLATLIVKHKDLGLDIGSETLLREYQALREADNLMMIEGTDCINSLFSNDFLPLRIGRRMAMKAINQIPFIKEKIMRYASQGSY